MCEMCEKRGKYLMASSMMAQLEHQDSDLPNAARKMVMMAVQSLFGVAALGGDTIPREARLEMLDEIKRLSLIGIDEVYDEAMERLNEKQPEGTGGDNIVPLNVRMH